ncbi:tetratricopeptide repeat protein [Amycolatopsis sp. 195334CR]|uniref:ATP-binding protein n=1 Tax=Amycolatopsis sp. 195334CR TaxID=2814588 RepID=UPI001A8EB179|nr:tetratricopeptide repeat protein [Amycolatopsis sp. 195334CR]MBN6034210.1 tetratricopeptide repeat protein [Amycolatopsis sp. 195334CR]
MIDAYLQMLGAEGTELGRLTDLYDRAYGAKTVKKDVPRQLPFGPQEFVGRSAELESLDKLLTLGTRKADIALISAVSGTAGVGKTALAVHWSSQAESRFPDGTLYVNMRGYDLEHAVEPAEALGEFLRALGVKKIPYARDERAKLFRSTMRNKKMLVVIDNVNAPEQVRPLLPGTTRSLVLITSRDALSGLVQRDGVKRIFLDVLSPEEAQELLRRLIGPRAGDAPEAVVRLAERCARLPLALRIAGELVAVRRQANLTDLVDELMEEQQRLDMFEVENDPRTAVRSVFSWSYGHLPRELQAVYRLIGFSPGRSFDAVGFAAVTDAEVPESGHRINALLRASLIKEVSANRFELYDLLREYGKELAESIDAPGDRVRSVQRLAEHLIWHSAVASDVLYATKHVGRVTAAKGRAEPFRGKPEMIKWFALERENTVLVCEWLAENEDADLTAAFSATMHRYFDANGYYEDQFTVQRSALAVAERSGDEESRLAAEMRIGTTWLRVGDLPQALEHYESVLDGNRTLGNVDGEARALGNKGLVFERAGRFPEAYESYVEALRLHRTDGDDEDIANSCANLGNVLESMGKYEDALGYFAEATQAYASSENVAGLGRTLNNIANVNYRLGHFEKALEGYRASLDLKRSIGDKLGEANTLANIGATLMSLERDEGALIELRRAKELTDQVGDVASKASITNNLASAYRETGRSEEALAYHEEALTISVQSQDRGLEAEILNDLATTLASVERYGEAAEHYRRAMTIAADGDNRYESARALDGLAKIAFVGGDLGKARDNWFKALAVFEALGTPQAARIRSHLAGMA